MIYDCFTYNNEKDILDIRMAILDPYVDYFVICESHQTFSGKPKPIYYTGNNPKVIHIIAPNIETDNAFERAGFQKDYIRTALTKCKDDDIIYFGDVDEIWKPQDIGDDVYNLQQFNYCYYLNNRSSEKWVGTIVSKYKNIKDNDLNYLRANHIHELKDGGWHFTNMGGYDKIIEKLEAYDHQEFNTEEVKARIKDRINNGEDYVGRKYDWLGNPFKFTVDMSGLPNYLIENKEKWSKLFL